MRKYTLECFSFWQLFSHFFVWRCPESPRWYVRNGYMEKAYRSLCCLRGTDIQAARDLYQIYTRIKLEKQDFGYSSYMGRFTQLFTIPQIRRATVASIVVMISRNMCGIGGIIVALESLSAYTGLQTNFRLLVVLGLHTVIVMVTFLARYVIDTFGRRRLLLASLSQIVWLLVVIGLCFRIEANLTKVIAVSFFIFVLAAFYAIGAGPVPFTYSAEIFPTCHRGMYFC